MKYRYFIPDSELDKFSPYIRSSIERGTEFKFLYRMVNRFPEGNVFYRDDDDCCVVHHTLDSYNKLKSCMDESTARYNSMLNGLELILINHFNNSEYASGYSFGDDDDG